MRRFLATVVIVALAIAVATPAQAGYLIIRVMLEGGAGAGGTPGHGPGPGTGPGPKPGGTSGAQRPTGKPPGGPGPGSPADPAGHPAHQEPSRCVVVVVPVEENITKQSNFYKRTFDQEKNPLWSPKIHSAYRGEKFTTNLFVDNVDIQIYEDLMKSPSPTKTRVSEVHDQYAKWAKTKSDVKGLYTIFLSALSIGLIEDATNYADELLALAAEKPDGLAADVKSFTTAYGKMQKAVKGSVEKNPRADSWVKRLGAATSRSQGHYTLISWDATEPEIKRRLDFLEENFRGFFLWHATQGITLPVPETSLLAVLARDPTANDAGTIYALARTVDGPPRLTADAFYTPDHDLLVFSPDRADDVGLTFVRQATQVFSAGVTRASLLAGDGPVLSVSGMNPDGKTPDDVARMQTTALVARLVEDNSTIESVSREGSRQLLYATRQLTRYVVLPEWLGNGSASFFDRSRVPAFINVGEDKHVMHVAASTGYVNPNYTQQRYFRDLQDKNELHPDRAVLLKNILTDAYFTSLRNTKDLHDPDPLKRDDSGVAIGGGDGPQPGAGPGSGAGPGPGGRQGPRPPGPGSGRPGVGPKGPGGAEGAPPEEDANVIVRKKRERLVIKTQATAWALYYYLAKARHAELESYLNELAELPRDVPLEGAALAAFYRAFKIDPAKEKEGLEQLAQSWLAYMNSVPPAGQDVSIKSPKAPAETDPKNPKGPNTGTGK